MPLKTPFLISSQVFYGMGGGSLRFPWWYTTWKKHGKPLKRIRFWNPRENMDPKLHNLAVLCYTYCLCIYIYTYMHNVEIITLKHIARHRAISATHFPEMNSFVSTPVVIYPYKPSFDGLFTFIKRMTRWTNFRFSSYPDQTFKAARCSWVLQMPMAKNWQEKSWVSHPTQYLCFPPFLVDAVGSCKVCLTRAPHGFPSWVPAMVS